MRQSRPLKQHYPLASFPNSGSNRTLALLLDKQQKIEIGQRIKWLRDNSAETSRTIAGHCDVSVEAVRNWLAGKGIAYDNAVKVADLFEIDVDWIWRGRGRGPDAARGQGPLLNVLDGDGVEELEPTQLDRIEHRLKAIMDHLGIEDLVGPDLPAPPESELQSDPPSRQAGTRSAGSRRSAQQPSS